MLTSIIIPTYNRLGSLKRVLNGLEQQTGIDLSALEVIVVSDGSTDGTEAYLQTLETPLRLKPILQENAGAAAARNAGLFAASGDLIMFLDDDVMPTPYLLAEHIRTHQESTIPIAVLGPMLTPTDFEMAPWVQWEQAMLDKQYLAMNHGAWEPSARQFFTGNTSIARQQLLAQGGFDTQFKRAEDVELAYRLADAGIKFVFNENAVGYHYAERSFASWLNIPYAYGVNDVIFALTKEQPWLLTAIWREFYQRNLLIQALTRLCLDRVALSQAMINLLQKLAQTAQARGKPALSHKAYSGIFNLRYYQGVADELGGRFVFFKKVINRRRPPTPVAIAESRTLQEHPF